MNACGSSSRSAPGSRRLPVSAILRARASLPKTHRNVNAPRRRTAEPRRIGPFPPRIMPIDVSRPDLTLAVIGTGVMGRGIAQIAAQAGVRTLLHDSRPGAAQDAKESVSGQLAKLAEKGRLERDALARAQANLVIADSHESLASCP